MIEILLQLAGAIGIGLLIGQAARTAEKVYRSKLATYRQEQWDAHVGEAVKVSDTPLYERIAQEFAKDLDEEWKRASTGEWGTA